MNNVAVNDILPLNAISAHTGNAYSLYTYRERLRVEAYREERDFFPLGDYPIIIFKGPENH